MWLRAYTGPVAQREKGSALKFFIDTANLEEIAEAKSWGCLAGVTTNPSLYAKTGGALADFEPHMQKIAELCKGLPVSAETTATTVDGMVADGRRLAALAPNIVIKLPICEAGLAACRILADEGIRVNMTLIFSATQALLAANAGARYISPFVGRYDDIALDGISQLADVITCIKNYDWSGKNPDGVVEIDHRLGAHGQPCGPSCPVGRRYRHRPHEGAQEMPPSSPHRCRHCGLRGRLGARRKRVRRGVGKVPHRFGGPVVVKRFIAGKHPCLRKK